jgi:DNA mismatch repair protein MutL
VHDLAPVPDIRQRIAAFFGDELSDGLIEIRSEDAEIRLAGYVANPMHSRATARLQYLFLNGRAIRDRALQHALCEAYRGLLLTGRQPICFLRLQMPPELVDVNVHPTKQEVRFQDSGRLYSQLLGTLRTKFLTTDLTAVGTTHHASGGANVSETESAAAGASALVAWAKEQLGQQIAAQEDAEPAPPMERQIDFGARASREPLRLHRLDVPPFQPFDIGLRPAENFRARPATEALNPSRDGLGDAPRQPAERTACRPDNGHPRAALQVHNRYLVVETDAGIEVIDQHALHERILYEQIREKVLGGALEAQMLLVPEPVDLSAGEAAAVLEQAELLAQLGVAVQPFGGETVLVSSYPAMLANLSPAEVLRELVEKLLAGGREPDARDLLDDLLHMIACKAAVKFGDRLTPEEIESLLAQRHLAEDSHHCPHGRPTTLVFTREDLDRQFKRI